MNRPLSSKRPMPQLVTNYLNLKFVQIQFRALKAVISEAESASFTHIIHQLTWRDSPTLFSRIPLNLWLQRKYFIANKRDTKTDLQGASWQAWNNFVNSSQTRSPYKDISSSWICLGQSSTRPRSKITSISQVHQVKYVHWTNLRDP